MVYLLFKQILSMMIMIASGFLLVKAGILQAKESSVLSSITIYLVLPCVIVGSFQIEITETVRRGFLTAVAIAVLYHFLLMAVCRMMRKIFALRPIEEASVYYSNSGNMIIPLVTSVIGKEMVIYASAFFCVQTIFMWTHGHSLVSGKKLTDYRSLLRNPNLISVGIGMLMFVTGLRLPALIQMPVDSIASVVGPVSMITIGMILTRVQWNSIFRSGRLYLITALRMFLVPAGTLLLLALCRKFFLQGVDKEIIFVSFMAMMAPTATSVMQMANLYRKEEVYAGMICAMTTLLCIVSMPLMAALYLKVM